MWIHRLQDMQSNTMKNIEHISVPRNSFQETFTNYFFSFPFKIKNIIKKKKNKMPIQKIPARFDLSFFCLTERQPLQSNAIFVDEKTDHFK